MRAEQPELDDHAVVEVAQRDQLVALVGEGAARLAEVFAHGRLAVVDRAARDQLVARMREGVDHGVEIVHVLGFHVAAHARLALLAQPVAITHGVSQRRRRRAAWPITRAQAPSASRKRRRLADGRTEPTHFWITPGARGSLPARKSSR